MTRVWWARRARHWFSPLTLVIVAAPVPGFVFASLLRGTPQWWALVPIAFAIAMVGVIGEHRAQADARRWATPAAPLITVQVDEVAYLAGTWADSPLPGQVADVIRAGAQVTPIEAARARALLADPTLTERHRREAEAAAALLADIRARTPNWGRFTMQGDDS